MWRDLALSPARQAVSAACTYPLGLFSLVYWINRLLRTRSHSIMKGSVFKSKGANVYGWRRVLGSVNSPEWASLTVPCERGEQRNCQAMGDGPSTSSPEQVVFIIFIFCTNCRLSHPLVESGGLWSDLSSGAGQAVGGGGPAISSAWAPFLGVPSFSRPSIACQDFWGGGAGGERASLKCGDELQTGGVCLPHPSPRQQDRAVWRVLVSGVFPLQR